MRNQSGGDAGPWNVGNTAHFTGTIDTEYVDGSSIQFLAGQTNMLGVNSGSYRPNPSDYTGGTINPDGTASGGDFTGTATAPGVYGARFRATVSVFGFPVTVDAAFASFYNTKYEIASDTLPIAAGSFPINTTNIGISDSMVAIDGLTVVTTQPVADAITRITNAVGPDGALTATVANTGPLTRRLTIPISLALSIPVDADPTHNLAATATGTIVADATLPATASSVVGQFLFYNQSGTSTRYDHNDLAINSFDDLAIATDKTAYTWEDPNAATFANVSSYSKGINGIMVDISGSHPSITAADFIFRVGNNNSPGTVGHGQCSHQRLGAGRGRHQRFGSRRDHLEHRRAPIKQWLEVITLANANTGLAQKVGYPVGQGDAFFFGNALGDTGVGDTTANCDGQCDRREPPFGPTTPWSAQHSDHQHLRLRSQCQVNANRPESAARLNATNPTTTLKYLNLTTAPAAPEADGFWRRGRRWHDQPLGCGRRRLGRQRRGFGLDGFDDERRAQLARRAFVDYDPAGQRRPEFGRPGPIVPAPARRQYAGLPCPAAEVRRRGGCPGSGRRTAGFAARRFGVADSRREPVPGSERSL